MSTERYAKALIGLLGLGVFAACSSPVGPELDTASPQYLYGDVTLPIANSSWTDHACTGTGDYSDIHEGAPVALKEDVGNPIAERDLIPATSAAGAGPCIFKFEAILGVKGHLTSSTYQVILGTHSSPIYSLRDLEQRDFTVSVDFGSPSS